MIKKRAVFYLLIIGFSFSFLFIAGNILEINAFDFLNPFYEGLVNLGVVSNAEISIDSPLNTTYNFSMGDDYNLSLNVSSNFNLSSWRYTLVSLPTGAVIYHNIPFTPNTTFNAVANSNELFVSANDTGGNVINKWVIFFISLPNSNPIIEEIDDKILVCESNSLSYDFNITDADGDDLTVDIYPGDPFFVSQFYSFSETLKGYKISSGILSKDNAGGVNAGSSIYPETITAFDGVGPDSKNTNITVIEVNNAPSISNIGVKTVWTRGENNHFNYQVMVSDIEDGDRDSGNLNFSITFSGENLFNISSNGVMNFTANSSYLGVHNVSVCVKDTGIDNPHQNISLCGQDGSSLTSCNNFSLTVTNQNREPNITNYSPLNLSFNATGSDLLYFNISKYDADGTIPDTYWYVDDVLKEYDSGNLIDDFSYIFGCGISGIHIVKSKITDGLLEDSIQWNVSVSEIVCPAGVSLGGGGGGGGGGGIVYCEENWVWEQWPQCKNLKKGFELKEINLEYEFLIKERCSLFNWSDSFCGYQIRTGRDLNLCKYNLTRLGVIRECYYTEFPTCDDNIKNCHSGGCEVLTDCGGPCKPCPTCSDKIKNQNEEDVDCGGSCPICIERPSAKGLKWFVYVFLVAFVIVLIIIIKLFIKSYKTEKEVKKLTSKRKGTLD